MKKIIYSLLIGFLVLSLTGCSKKLTCENTLTKEADGVAMVSKVSVTFNDDLSDKATILYVFEDEETASTYYEYIKESSENFKLNGKTISITEEIEDEEKLSYEEAKTEFTDQGYTCK